MTPEENHLRQNLELDETILWSKVPARAPVSAFGLAIFYIISTTAILCLWFFFMGPILVEILFSGVVNFFTLMVLMFFIVAIGQIGVCLVAILRRGHFAYALTDRRVIITNHWFISTARSFKRRDLQQIGHAQTGEKGTIFLASPSFFYRGYRDRWSRLMTPARLYGLDDDRKVHDLIRSTLL